MKQRRRSVNTTTEPSGSYQNFWAIIFIVIIFDQLSKLIAYAVSDTIVQNTGTVFGLFANSNVFFTISSLVIIGGLVLLLMKKQHDTRRSRIYVFCLMLIIGGGLSNVLDRIFRGYVVDFIKVPLWPTFNLADFCISIGVTVIIWHAFFKEAREEV